MASCTRVDLSCWTFDGRTTTSHSFIHGHGHTYIWDGRRLGLPILVRGRGIAGFFVHARIYMVGWLVETVDVEKKKLMRPYPSIPLFCSTSPLWTLMRRFFFVILVFGVVV